MPIPESVKVTFKGRMGDHMDFRDVVHATQAQMLDQFGDNVFQAGLSRSISARCSRTRPSRSRTGPPR